MKKKFFLSLMALCMVLSLCSVTALAADADAGDSAATYVAEINGEKYETLQAALSAAEDGDTVTLLTDVTSSSNIWINTSGVTLNLNSNTITSKYQCAICIGENVTATVKNGTLTGGSFSTVYVYKGSANLTIEKCTVTSSEGAGGIYDYGTKSSVKLTDCDVTGDYFAVYHNGSTAGFTLTATNSTITAVEGTEISACAIYVSGNSTNSAEDADGMNSIELTNCTVTGPTGIEGKYTNMTLTDCDITATAEAAFEQNNNGSTALGFAVVSTDNTMTPNSPKPQSTITISGGSYDGLVGLSKLDAVAEYEEFKEAEYTVTSGTFSGDVSDYLADDADDVEYNTVLKPADCTNNGIGKLIKIEGGKTTTSYYVIPASHKEAEAVEENKVEASCTEAGSYDSVVYCSVCKEELTRETVTVEALGHTAPTSEYDVTIVAATCAKDGSKTYICTVCSTEVTEVIPATGEHTYEEGYTEATCTEPAMVGEICSVCGEAEGELVPVGEPNGHKYEEEVTEEATCVEDGLMTYTCTVCGDSYTEVIPATGKHTDEVVDAKEPTCGEAGNTEGVKCSVCDATLYGCEEIPATGEHTEETVAGKPATCTNTGLTDGVKCSVCGETLVEQEEIPVDPDAHDYEVTPLKDATCTTTGVGKYVCKDCGASKYATIPAEHKWNDGEVTTEASCTETGVKTFTCTVCSETKTEEIPAKDHSWNEGEETKAADCGNEGVKTYTCTTCGDTKTEVIEATGEHNYKEDVKDATCTEPAMVGEICTVCGQAKGELVPVGEPNGHKYEKEVTKEATCVEAGEETYTCSVCEDSYTEVIPATGEHKDELVEAKEPTCVEAGNTEGVKCSVCGEILYGCEEIPATGKHTEETVAGKPATCKDTGLTDGVKCSVCEEVLVAQEEIPVDPNAHNYELSTTLKAATCTTTGIGKYVCSNCGDYYYEIIEASHSWDEGTVNEQATCGKDGLMTYTCTVEGCGATKTEVIPATGEHDYKEGVDEATCTENAKVGFVCSVCGAVDPDRETVEVPGTMIPHDYEEVTVPATCTEDGSVTKTCSVCGDTKTEVIPATGHTEGDSEYIDATCTENGKDVVKCTVCGEIIEETDMGELDPATGHTPETIPAVDATCGATGLTEGVKCSVCGVILVAQEEIPADPDAHKYEVTSLKAATCSATGIGKYTCSICGDSYYGIIEKIAHTFDEDSAEVTKEATCTEAGILTVTCTECGATEERVIEALGHTWSDEKASDDNKYVYKECSACGETEIIQWLICEHETTEVQNAKDATCTENGYTGDTVCTDCGETVAEGEEIPALGHTPAEAVEENRVEPTETEDGSYDSVVYCTVCGEELSRETETIPATGPAVCEHETTALQNAKDATCTEAGYTGDKVCTACGETVEEGEEIPALGHTPAEAVVENRVEPTETEDGSYDSVVYCSVCGEELSREAVTIPATGPVVCEHETTEVQNAKDATCTEAGYTGDKVCTACGETVEEGEEIPALGHTPAEAVEENRVEPTETEDGSYDSVVYCSVCGEELSRETETIPATGPVVCEHETTELQNAKDATCTEAGYTGDKVCTACGETVEEGEEIPAKGHTEVTDAAVEATCGTAGLTEGSHCSECGEVIVAQEVVPATGKHEYETTVNEDGTVTYTCPVCGDSFTEAL